MITETREQLKQRAAKIQEDLGTLRVKKSLLDSYTTPIVWEYTIQAYDQRNGGGYKQDPILTHKVVTLRSEVPEILVEKVLALLDQEITENLGDLQEITKQLNEDNQEGGDNG